MSVEAFKSIYIPYPGQDPCERIIAQLEGMTLSDEKLKSPIEERVSFLTRELRVVDDEAEFWRLKELRILKGNGRRINETKEEYLFEKMLEEEGDSDLDFINSHPIAVIHTMPDSTLVEWNRLKKSCGDGRSITAYECETLKDKAGKKGASEYLKGTMVFRKPIKLRPGFLNDYQAITIFKKSLTDRESSVFLSDYIPVITRPALEKGIKHKNLIYQDHPICEYRDLYESVGYLSKEEQVKIVEELFGKLARYLELNLYPVCIKKLFYRREGSRIEAFFTQEFLHRLSLDKMAKEGAFIELGKLLARCFVVSPDTPLTTESLDEVKCPKEASKLIMKAISGEPLDLPQIPENIAHMPLTEFIGAFANFYRDYLNLFIFYKREASLTSPLLFGLHTLIKKGYILCDMQRYNMRCRENGEGYEVVLNDFEGLVDFELIKKNATYQGLLTLMLHFEGRKMSCFNEYVKEEQNLIINKMETLLAKGFDRKDLDVLHQDLNRFQILAMGSSINDMQFSSYSPLLQLIQRMIDPDPLKRPTVDELLI